MDRRTYLTSFIAGLTGVLAGCTGETTDATTSPNSLAPTTTPETTATPARTSTPLFDPAEYRAFRRKQLVANAYLDIEQHLTAAGELDGSEHRVLFPNSGGNYGHWDPVAFEETSDVDEVLWWANAATQAYMHQYEENPFNEMDRLASTVEYLITEHHPEMDVTSGHFRSVEHESEDLLGVEKGVMITKNGLRFLHPDSPKPTLIEAVERTEYNPFVKGFPRDDSPTPRTRQRELAERAILSFAHPGIAKPQPPSEKSELEWIHSHDDWLRGVFGSLSVLREGIETAQVAVFAQHTKPDPIEVTATGTVRILERDTSLEVTEIDSEGPNKRGRIDLSTVVRNTDQNTKACGYLHREIELADGTTFVKTGEVCLSKGEESIYTNAFEIPDEKLSSAESYEADAWIL